MSGFVISGLDPAPFTGLYGLSDTALAERGVVRMAVEDVGLADPRAVEQAIACMQTVHFLGVPEGDPAALANSRMTS